MDTQVRGKHQENPWSRPHYGILSAAAHTVGGTQIRNLGTLGGNACNASPAADTAPALVALEATAKIYGSEGERFIPIEELFAGVGRTTLKTGDVLTEFRIPPLPPRTGGIYIKHSPRTQMDISVIGVAAIITLAPQDGVCVDARIALGSVAPVVFRARNAEAILRGSVLDEDVIGRAARAAAEEARPIDDLRAPAEYRREMVEVLTKRAARYALDMARNGMPIKKQMDIAVEKVL
ncbi:MAG: carbon monoxide dehydrogenase medium chain [Dehalococcoidia bacterium]|nr:carbon monoxide dehydrogenase medium chain [Dehalococcoidia bacterium]